MKNQINFTCTIDGKKFEAQCESSYAKHFFHQPMFRVKMEPVGVFIYYLSDDEETEKPKLFWFELPGEKERTAKKLARSLEKHLHLIN